MGEKRTEAGIADPVVEDTGDLAKLVDQVVEGNAPIVVARDGEPKAALVSMDDYARLKREAEGTQLDKQLSWGEWFNKNQGVHQAILARREGKPLDQDVVERAWQEAREELEERDSRHAGFGR